MITTIRWVLGLASGLAIALLFDIGVWRLNDSGGASTGNASGLLFVGLAALLVAASVSVNHPQGDATVAGLAVVVLAGMVFGSPTEITGGQWTGGNVAHQIGNTRLVAALSATIVAGSVVGLRRLKR